MAIAHMTAGGPTVVAGGGVTAARATSEALCPTLSSVPASTPSTTATASASTTPPDPKPPRRHVRIACLPAAPVLAPGRATRCPRPNRARPRERCVSAHAVRLAPGPGVGMRERCLCVPAAGGASCVHRSHAGAPSGASRMAERLWTVADRTVQMSAAVPVYRLREEPVFPPPAHAEPSGLLAVGGDLSPERLLTAYCRGIFPWFGEGEPILWFSPDPRAVIPTADLRPDRGMRRSLEKADFTLRMDSAFEDVIRACAEAPRPGLPGTWITGEMIDAYCRLHELGFAHSVEAYSDGELVGGVYGVGIGAYFAGESMFHRRTGASLSALVALVLQLRAWGVSLFDCQTPSPHVGRLGAQAWPRRRFLHALEHAVAAPTRRGLWTFDADLAL
jgi:leucyl/phenylalanyl-tRNA--protein transferase